MSKADARPGRGQDPGQHTEPVQAYEDLLQLNQGFEQVLNSLHRLRKRRGFKGAQVADLREWVREARAATNSYVTGVLETEETEAAGRLYRRRRSLQQERENCGATLPMR